MSDELIIEQPKSGVWLSPGNRLGHLVALFRCTAKEKRYDELSQKEKDCATFEFVDLDQERELLSGMDNHPGITNKLTVGNPAVVLGRIRKLPSKQFAQDAIVLLEHDEQDAARLQEWHKAWLAGVRPNGTQTVTQTQVRAPSGPVAQGPTTATSTTGGVQVPAPAPAVPGLDLSTLDPATLALLQKAIVGNGG